MSRRHEALRDAILVTVRRLEKATTKQIVAEMFTDGAAYPYRYYPSVYSNLRALSNLGFVVWHPWEPVAGTQWSPAPSDAAPADDLEDLWTVSS